MGPITESVDSNHIGQFPDAHFIPVANLSGCSSLPYILAEAMVNHKKMVHPPCVL